MNEAYLQKILDTAGINTSEWGQNSAKTLTHLVKEINADETVLVGAGTSEVRRQIIVCCANVYYESKSDSLILRESEQVFIDGRKRNRELPQSIAEKIKANENPTEAIVRGIREELGLQGNLLIEQLESTTSEQESPSYPGLTTESILHNFKIDLTTEQFNPNGYIEIQSDKTTYFTWQPIEKKT